MLEQGEKDNKKKKNTTAAKTQSAEKHQMPSQLPWCEAYMYVLPMYLPHDPAPWWGEEKVIEYLSQGVVRTLNVLVAFIDVYSSFEFMLEADRF